MKKVITIKGLSKLVAEESDYFIYEAEDILFSLVTVLKRELLKGNQIHLEDFAKFHIERSKRKNIYSAPKKTLYFSPGRKRIRFLPMEDFRKQIYVGEGVQHFHDKNE